MSGAAPARGLGRVPTVAHSAAYVPTHKPGSVAVIDALLDRVVSAPRKVDAKHTRKQQGGLLGQNWMGRVGNATAL